MARDISKLYPRLIEIIGRFLTECGKQGFNVKIGECVRTVAEQDALYAQGRTTPGNIVTNARGSSYSSMHQWGIAFDFFRNEKGMEFANTDGFFDKVGQIGKSLGLEWGGDWKSLVDKPHLQLPDWGSTATALKSQYGTPENFMLTWGAKPTTPPQESTVVMKPDEPDKPKQEPEATLTASRPKGTSEDVLFLQKGLNIDGFTDSSGMKLAEDGLFGTKTESAIGKVRLSTKTKGSFKCTTSWLQARVGTMPDGLFGAKTDAAVRAYQMANTLTVDGIAGSKTLLSIVRKYV